MNYLVLAIILCGQLFGDAVFTGNASDGENSLYYSTFDQIVGDPVDTPREWVGFARQYGREDDGYSANDGNTYRVGRTFVDVVVESESMPAVYESSHSGHRSNRIQRNYSRRGYRSSLPYRDAEYVPGGRQTVYVAEYD